MPEPELSLFSDIRGYEEVLAPELKDLESRRRDEYLEMCRMYGEQDLFFLLRFVLSTRHWVDDRGNPRMAHPFVLERCRDVAAAEDGVVDIWSREHLKSTIKTFGKNLQDVINSRGEITIAIISNKLKLSIRFGRQIQREAETNPLLHELWPEVFWADPKNEAPRWSLSSQEPVLEFKRLANVKEGTIECVGLDAALPTGPHWAKLHFDDAVTRESVTTEEMMAKTQERWQSALSLGREGGVESYSGTFYHSLDLYNHMRGVVRTDGSQVYAFRVIPCRTTNDRPVFFGEAYLQDKRFKVGEKEFWTQWMCEPERGETRQLDVTWLKFYENDPADFHEASRTYILVDPANKKRKRSDFTVIWVVDVGPDGAWRVVDGVRDRLDPGERIEAVIDLWRMWDHDGFAECRYEEYGMQSDIYWLEVEQAKNAAQFPVVKVADFASKDDRIGQLVKPLKDGIIYFPERLIRRCQYKGGSEVDLIQVLLEEEYKRYPLSMHDDMLDCLSRLADPQNPPRAPGSRATQKRKRDSYQRALDRQRAAQRGTGNWIAP